MIHYHGGVINDRHGFDDLTAMVGRHFCVSFAYPDKVEFVHRIAQSVMLDNGAFSLWKQGHEVDWNQFYEWCEPWLEYWSSWAVIPDVINGGEEENDELLEQWPFGKDRGAPVWHFDESFERLDRLVRGYPLVCIGSAAEYEPLGGEKWRRRMDAAMEVCCDKRGVAHTRLHLLRGLAFSAGPYPLYSADSATVSRRRGGSPQNGIPRADLLKLYQETDAKNTPPRFHFSRQESLGLEEPEEYVTGLDAVAAARGARSAELMPHRRDEEHALFSDRESLEEQR